MVCGRRRAMSANVALEKITYKGTSSCRASWSRVAFSAAISSWSSGCCPDRSSPSSLGRNTAGAAR